MSKNDTRVSAEAWERLVGRYREMGGEEADDNELACLVRSLVWEVEGE